MDIPFFLLKSMSCVFMLVDYLSSYSRKLSTSETSWNPESLVNHLLPKVENLGSFQSDALSHFVEYKFFGHDLEGRSKKFLRIELKTLF